MRIDETTCWYQKSSYKNMIDSLFKYPLLETPPGQLLNQMIKSIDYDLCLDIGCGTGQIGQIAKNYTGLDLDHIIENVAKKAFPNFCYLKKDIIQNRNMIYMEKYDLIIMSAFIDIMERPVGILGDILMYCQKYVILHRQEISKEKPTQSFKNKSYGSWTWHSIINRNDFDTLIKDFEIIKEESCGYDNWEDSGHSFILKRIRN